MNKLIPSFFGSLVFYTTLRLPIVLELDFAKIVRWITLIGILIGSLLGIIDLIFSHINLPIFTRSVLIIGIWIYVTGGLHLDGVIDTADGLAVPDQQRRLEVMKDSATGAFGVIAAVILLLLKVASLTDISSYRYLALILATTWGRWGQLIAIAFYPYLRKDGKGAFHKQSLNLPHDLFLGSMVIVFLGVTQFLVTDHPWWLIIVIQLSCAVIALVSGYWFKMQLGGHTGDTYGATVEWSEGLILCFLTIYF
jgi:adenosylcobinamide-GDP ribazoletransferase